MAAAYKTFVDLVKELRELHERLPASIPLSSKDSRVAEVFKKFPIPKNAMEAWEVFNRRMDALFSEDLRTNGRLPNIQRGRYGIGMVVSYFEAVIEGNGALEWEAAIPKLSRLKEELGSHITSTPVVPKAALQPTPAVPADKPKRGAKAKEKRRAAVPGGAESPDEDYVPPKRRVEVDEEYDDRPVFDSDGEEMADPCDFMQDISDRRARKRARSKSVTSVGTSDGEDGNKSRSLPKKARVSSTIRKPSELTSDAESDGESAIRAVEAEGEAPRAARRGPPNMAMQHYLEPIPVTVDGKWKWEFPCRYCNKFRRVERTVSAKSTFDDEPRLPGLTNLPGHTKDCKSKKLHDEREAARAKADAVAAEKEAGGDAGRVFSYRDGEELMRRWIDKGILDPAVEPTQAGFVRLIAAWILEEDLPWTTGESPRLEQLFRYLKVKFMLPTDTTVRNQLAHIFKEIFEKVVKEFSNVKSKIAYATDTWTNKQMIYTFAATIASFVDDDWNLIERVIEFKPLEPNEHEGYHGARAFVQGARRVGSLNKIRPCTLPAMWRKLTSQTLHFSALVMDNASVNDVIFKQTALYLLTLYQIDNNPDRQIRCLAHVINLVAQAILAGLDEAATPEEEKDSTTDYFLQHKDNPIHYQVSDNEELQDLEKNRSADLKASDEALDELEKALADIPDELNTVEEEVDSLGALSALKRLRFICTKITASPQLRKAFWECSRDAYKDRRVDPSDERSTLLRMLMVIRDVRTRWNSTHAMLSRALLLADAIDQWVGTMKKYRSLALSKRDWAELRALCDVLEPFTEATKILSNAHSATLPFVLPIYLNLEQHITTGVRNYSLPPTLRGALTLGKAKLLKYKSLAETNHVYMIGTMLHPSMRAEWFRKMATPAGSAEKDKEAQEKCVDNAKTIFESAVHGYLEDTGLIPVVNQPTPSVTAPPLGRSGSSSLLDICSVEFTVTQTAMPLSPKEQLQDELTRYYNFQGGRPGDVMDSLGWWKVHETLFPTLARVARDYLAIPATSVSVERIFTKSRHICQDLRSSLHAETIREALLTKCWLRAGLFDPIAKPGRIEKHGSVRLLRP